MNVQTAKVTLSPTPGFVVKTSAESSSVYVLSPPTPPVPQQNKPTLLEPSNPAPNTLQIPKGIKVFINIAWDANVPAPPPDASESAIRKAMMGEDVHEGDGKEGTVLGEGEYYVPVVVTEPRADMDKAGKPSIVFDCIVNPAIKARTAKDMEFRTYIIELALERSEEKSNTSLSRQISSPNIASKGKLEKRVVSIPIALYRGGLPAGVQITGDEMRAENGKSGGKKLIEEVSSNTKDAKGKGKEIQQKNETKPLKSALKKSATNVVNPVSDQIVERKSTRSQASTKSESFTPALDTIGLPSPYWTWSKSNVTESTKKESGEKSEKVVERIIVEIDVPGLVESASISTLPLHASTTLDIEPRLLVLHIPNTYFLKIDLSLSDAEIAARQASSKSSTTESTSSTMVSPIEQAHKLKRERDFDVEGARAEWRVDDGKVFVFL